MIRKKNYILSFITHLLVVAVLFPAAVQFSHLFEDHEHNFCGNVTTHLHEQQLDCDFSKIFAPLHHYPIRKDSEGFTVTIPTLQEYAYEQTVAQQLSQSYFLRGPPNA